VINLKPNTYIGGPAH